MKRDGKQKTYPVFRDMVGKSAEMGKVFDRIERFAKTERTVLILGESGVGKELAARAVHESSRRKGNPFVAVNCAALSGQLIESELFGHEKGAFTGALQKRTGRFETARSGSLFLDEIGDMPMVLQPKLLRVLQEGTFEPVGSDRTVRSDVRIIAATNRDLMERQRAGKFREDLYYRLNVLTITLPPLRERPEDVEILARVFLERFAKEMNLPDLEISPSAMRELKRHEFPGNVRELKNLVERAVVEADGSIIESFDFSGSRNDDFRRTGGAEDELPQKAERKVLMAKLTKIEVVSGKRTVKWHEQLRCVSIEKICDFLHETGGGEFGREEFARFLRQESNKDGNKYKTAGEFLKILTRNGVCGHNGEKANRSRFFMSNRSDG